MAQPRTLFRSYKPINNFTSNQRHNKLYFVHRRRIGVTNLPITNAAASYLFVRITPVTRSSTEWSVATYIFLVQGLRLLGNAPDFTFRPIRYSPVYVVCWEFWSQISHTEKPTGWTWRSKLLIYLRFWSG